MRRHLRLVLLASTSILLACALMGAAPVGQPRTVEGVVDGQKFGTNLLGEGVSVSFEADSASEARLLQACDPGDRCKVMVITGKADVVLKLISAERVTATVKPNPIAPAVMSPGPSFACEKAATLVERSICADAALSTLDRELAAAYRRKMDANPNERKQIQQQQREWVSTVRNVCKEAACLRAAYQDRLERLSRQ